MSNRRKRKEILARSQARTRSKGHGVLARGLQDGSVVRVDPTKIFSRSVLPGIPEFYHNLDFYGKAPGAIY